MKPLTLSIVLEWLKALEHLESDNLRWLLLTKASPSPPLAPKPEKPLRQLVFEVAQLRQTLTQPTNAPHAAAWQGALQPMAAPYAAYPHPAALYPMELELRV